MLPVFLSFALDAMTVPQSASISDHAGPADVRLRRVLGPRVRRLHARIGKAHHQAEGMRVSLALLAGRAEPLQLAALVRALAPAYALLEQEAPALAAALGGAAIPWRSLARSTALHHDIAVLAALPPTPVSLAAAVWLEHLQRLCRQAPHRLMAHVYVRYGGDLSGGQKLAQQANAILVAHGLSPLSFWTFERPVEQLKLRLHEGFEALDLSEQEDAELLEEAEVAFQFTQQLLAELEGVTEAAASSRRGPLELLLKYDQPVPRYTSYPTAAAFTPAVGEKQLRAQLGQPTVAPLSLYVHVPFCRHACWYCGCNRVTTHLGSKVVEPYLESLAQELELVSRALAAPRRLSQLHWGGGTPNYLTDEADLHTMLAGVKLARQVAAAKPLDAYRGAEFWPGAAVQGDDALIAYIRQRSETLYHPIGTCKMGQDPLAGVDSQLRVYGVSGLRVADASIMPTINNGHTHAPVVMIGEKAADLLS